MSEEFGPDFITVTDEDGNEFELEHLDTLEYNGQTYMAFFPAVAAGQDGEPADGEEEDYGSTSQAMPMTVKTAATA